MLRKSGSAIASLAAMPCRYATPALLRRLARYGSVGLAFSLFYSLAVIAFIVALPIASFAHRNISFFDSQWDTFQPLRFAVTTAASFVLAVGGMYWITEIARRDYLLGIAWNWLGIPAVNFVVYIVWVFRATQTARLGGSPAQSRQEDRFD